MSGPITDADIELQAWMKETGVELFRSTTWGQHAAEQREWLTSIVEPAVK